MPPKPAYDRALVLFGPKRNQVLTLEEVWQYGVDSFSDPDLVKILWDGAGRMVPAGYPAARPNSNRMHSRHTR